MSATAAEPCAQPLGETAPGEAGIDQKFLRTSDARGLLHLLAHLLLLYCSGRCVLWCAQHAGWCAWLVVSAAHGSVLTHLYAPLHECTHYTAFRSRPLCDAVGWLCGVATTFNADCGLLHLRCLGPRRLRAFIRG